MVHRAAVIFDVDGTLVDSNDAHARAWVGAFAEHGITVSYESVRRAIGMGGDKLMPFVAGLEEESPTGSSVSSPRRCTSGTQLQGSRASSCATASAGHRSHGSGPAPLRS